MDGKHGYKLVEDTSRIAGFNSIENLWHELKEYIRRVTKPMNKADLVQGILNFWKTVDAAKCHKYTLKSSTKSNRHSWWTYRILVNLLLHVF